MRTTTYSISVSEKTPNYIQDHIQNDRNEKELQQPASSTYVDSWAKKRYPPSKEWNSTTVVATITASINRWCILRWIDIQVVIVIRPARASIHMHYVQNPTTQACALKLHTTIKWTLQYTQCCEVTHLSRTTTLQLNSREQSTAHVNRLLLYLLPSP